jgi:uncharacterized membrane protein YfcA
MDPWILAPAFFIGALLYSSVGHGGASAYLAIMALAHAAPESMRPLALSLNLVVAGVAALQYARAGHLDWRLLWPFVIGSVPLAFLGGLMDLPEFWYRSVIGLVLMYAAISLWWGSIKVEEAPVVAPSVPVAIAAGGVLGLAAGLTGVGGGIFLSPLLMLMNWARAKPTAAVSALFIWLNSLSGLLAQADRVPPILDELLWAGPAVLAGGLLGAWIGARRTPPRLLRRLLSVVLAVAAWKLLATAVAAWSNGG